MAIRKYIFLLLVPCSLLLTPAYAADSVKDLQKQCLEILVQNSWTRASSIAIDYLRFSKKMFDTCGVKYRQYVPSNKVVKLEL